MSDFCFATDPFQDISATAIFCLAPGQEDGKNSSPAKPPTNRPVDQDNRAAGQRLAKLAIAGTGDVAATWDRLLADEKLTSDQFFEAIIYLQSRQHYDVAIEGLLSAIRNDRAAPMMYDVLALQMKLANRPPKEIARVLDSRIDFAASDVPQMLITAAWLSRFELWDRSRKVCREALEANPELQESWLLARSIADKSGNIEERAWVRSGILKHVWGPDYEAQHDEARTVLKEIARQCDRDGKSDLGQQIREQAAAAQAVDLQVSLSWVGPADLDLLITEPGGEKCSYKRRITANLGRLVREEGVGDEQKSGMKHSELYVCHSAPSGEYEIAVRFVLGKAATGTAVLEIIQHAGTPLEHRSAKTIRLAKEDVRIATSLEGGRAEKK